MKIHKALKVKNRLVGEVVRLQEILKRENSRRSDNQSTIIPENVYSELISTFKKLTLIKTAIKQASVPVYEKIERIAELKGYINFLNTLPTRKGEETILHPTHEKIVYQWTSFIDKEKQDDLIVAVQKEINEYQDEVDTFNAVTEVNYTE